VIQRRHSRGAEAGLSRLAAGSPLTAGGGAIQRACPNGELETTLPRGGGRPLAACGQAVVRDGGGQDLARGGDLAWVLAGGQAWWSGGVRGGRGERLLSISRD
jgi:hypothetical protein